jgi:flagellar basal body rod protein FlgG
MLQGLYFSAQGAQLQSLRQDVIANTLANAGSTGFKRDLVQAQAFLPREAEDGRAVRPDQMAPFPGGTGPYATVTDFSQGSLQVTKNPWDVALTGAGFLHVTDGENNYLTRDGRLAISPQGQLITRDHNLAVLGAGGRPMLGLDPAVIPQITSTGTVVQNGVEVGRMALVAPENLQTLMKTGDNLYRTDAPVGRGPIDTSVKQGYLESSGTQPMKEMLELIESSRGFEANLNMIKAQDEALGRLLQTIGRK